MKHVNRMLRKVRRGQGGFTLIELLIVVAILGVISAVVVLNVGNFFGTGNLEAAKTELHQAQTAIVACMADAGASSLSSSGDWDGSAGVVTATDGTNTYDAADYIYGKFKATYTVTANGEITNGVVLSSGGWSGIVWDNTTSNWKAQ